MSEFAISVSTTEPLFFRDGRPATMGGTIFSSGLFPPSPSVLYGALRSAYFSQHDTGTFVKRNTPDDPTRKFILNGIFYQAGTKIFLPLPADLVLLKNQTKFTPLHLKYIGDSFVSNHVSDYCFSLGHMAKNEENDKIYLDSEAFIGYLEGIIPPNYINLQDYLTSSSKVGISRQNGVVREGALFRFDRTQLQGKKGQLTFLLTGHNLDLNEKGRIELGSDGTTAFYQATQSLLIPHPLLKVGETVKLVLITPGLFKKGWLPEILTTSGLKVLTCAIGKSYGIGGFDMQTNAPKTMYRAVPAGGVYVIQIKSQEGLDTLLAHHGKSWSDYMPEQGFGLGYIARCLSVQQL